MKNKTINTILELILNNTLFKYKQVFKINKINGRPKISYKEKNNKLYNINQID